MKIKNYNLQFYFVLLMLFISLLHSALAEQDSPVIWRVKSLYIHQLSHRMQPPMIWEYQLTKEDDSYVLSVREKDNPDGINAALLLDKAKHIYKINTFITVAGKKKQITHTFDPSQPVIIESTLVPCNWLNGDLPWDGKNRVYTIIKKIGTVASFAEKYLVKGKVIDIEEAIDLGLISGKFLNLDLISPKLLLLTVERLNEDRPDEEVIKQLWSKNVDFWLYEKTPFRESWYMSGK